MYDSARLPGHPVVGVVVRTVLSSSVFSWLVNPVAASGPDVAATAVGCPIHGGAGRWPRIGSDREPDLWHHRAAALLSGATLLIACSRGVGW